MKIHGGFSTQETIKIVGKKGGIKHENRGAYYQGCYEDPRKFYEDRPRV